MNNPKYSNLINFQNVTFSDKERAYLIVKAVVRLSDPAAMDLVLRKRISFNIYKRHSITDKIRRRMGHTSSLTSLGVFYEVVSNIPKVSIQMIVLLIVEMLRFSILRMLIMRVILLCHKLISTLVSVIICGLPKKNMSFLTMQIKYFSSHHNANKQP